LTEDVGEEIGSSRLDYATRARLQRVRFLLLEAVARSQDLTDIGVHTAAILLDGACEAAMFLAAQERGLGVEKSFPTTLNRLVADRGAGWFAPGRAGVEQLHAARNAAQHQGVLIAEGQLSTWAADAQRFVESLVAAVFKVELDEVLLAEAVAHPEIRVHLVDAETHLDAGDPSTSFASVINAFELGRRQWRGQREQGFGSLPLVASKYPMGDPLIDPVNRALVRTEEIAEVTPFSLDIAEYHWFVVRRAEHLDDFSCTEADAWRALRFVLTWILRWEAFSARFDDRRLRPPAPAYKPPRAGQGRPSVYSATIEQRAHAGGVYEDASITDTNWSVRVVIADPPAQYADWWAEELRSELIDEAKRIGVDVGAVTQSGIVHLYAIPATVDGGAIVDAVDHALRAADERLVARVAAHAVIEGKLGEMRDDLAELVNNVTVDGEPFVVSSVMTVGSDPARIGLMLRRSDDDPILGHLLDEVVSQARAGVAGVHDYHSATVWVEPDVDPELIRTLIAEIAEVYGERATARRVGLASVEERDAQLRRELDDAVRTLGTTNTKPGGATDSHAKRGLAVTEAAENVVSITSASAQPTLLAVPVGDRLVSGLHPGSARGASVDGQPVHGRRQL
jgi:hypothetical protein